VRSCQDLRELFVPETEQQLIRVMEPVKFEPDLAAATCALTKITRQRLRLAVSPAACGYAMTWKR
jgi:hypothetical protein